MKHLANYKFVLISIITFFSLLTFSCGTRHEELVEKVNDLMEKEKYETALETIQKEMKRKRSNDRELSDNSPENPRVIKSSRDKKRIVWIEDNELYSWDRENDEINHKSLKGVPQAISISADGKYAVLNMPLRNNHGCKIKAISVFDGSLDYESGAHISCRNAGGISNDGGVIYYFIDENIYREKTIEPKTPQKTISSSRLSAPYKKLKNRLVMEPWGDAFLIFYGIGGAYNLFLFDPEKESVKMIAETIMATEVFSNTQDSYLIGGSIGNMKLRQINAKNTSVSSGVAIDDKGINPWPISTGEFISGDADGIYLWKKGSDPKRCPVLYDRFWGIDDKIIYENSEGLFTSDPTFTEEEWELVNLMKQVKERL